MASLPLLSGCITNYTLVKANEPTGQWTRRYGAADKISAAALTRDKQLCIFFENNPSEAVKDRQFSLTVSLWCLSANAQQLCDGDFRSADGNGLKRHVSYAVLPIPGSQISPNRPLLKIARADLKFIPVGDRIMNREIGPGFYRHTDFPLLSNATQTVYLTRTNPIEFVYVDASSKRSFDVVTVLPVQVPITKKRPACYALLPITVPADIATSPFQAIGLLWFWLLLGHGQC